jgi:hypothetical protein
MKFFIISAFFLCFLILAAGCSSAPGTLSETPAPTIMVSPSVPTASFTATSTPSDTPVIPDDPIIGTWMGYSYAGGDRYERIYTFWKNNTWTRLDRNLTDRTKADSHGTWKNGANNQYPMHFSVSGTSGTFRYDPAKDELFDPYYQETFRRTADSGSSAPPAPVINLTLNAEQKVSRLGDFRPFSGKMFLIVNITIRNIHERDGFPLDDKSLHVVFDDKPGIYADNGDLGGPLENLLPFGTIRPGEIWQGNVIFAVPKSSYSYILKLVDIRGDDASNSITFVNSTA